MGVRLIIRNSDNFNYTYYDVNYELNEIRYLLKELEKNGYNHTNIVHCIVDSNKVTHEVTHDTLNYFIEDDEMYIITYYVGKFCYSNEVDYCITKEEILNNFNSGKYDDGAYYCTIGQAMKSTQEFFELFNKYNRRKHLTVDEIVECLEDMVDEPYLTEYQNDVISEAISVLLNS